MKKIIAVLTGVILITSAFAQTRVVHGRLTVYNIYPVKNVEVTSKKAKSTTKSDTLGQFSIVCLENDVIKIKPKIFQSVNKKVGPDTDSLIINLLFIDSKVNRERAIGYGYISEKDLTFAVSHLEQENNNFCSFSNIYELIRGQLASVTVSGTDIYVRGGINSFTPGASGALTVVDGIPYSSIDWISPCQVKSIDVLKDSNTAIYGTRGANGVIIIQLKK